VVIGKGKAKDASQGKEPKFIDTSRYDGRKTVNLDKLFKDPEAQVQMKQLYEKVIRKRLTEEQRKGRRYEQQEEQGQQPTDQQQGQQAADQQQDQTR
jgi:hypothetical protein